MAAMITSWRPHHENDGSTVMATVLLRFSRHLNYSIPYQEQVSSSDFSILCKKKKKKWPTDFFVYPILVFSSCDCSPQRIEPLCDSRQKILYTEEYVNISEAIKGGIGVQLKM